uniref:Late embryogenesis abundant protein LEA1-2 n=1 Tax=Pinus tabuliformis TaxID=88731 RepID=A0A0A7RK39_PINTB|nr:late embryogenesis abundant protein LEA1-2 [Pinus tabuliformis]
MQTAKEKMSNMGSDVKEGMDKAKASAQEKVEKVTAHNPADKEIAREKKDVKQTEAEMRANAGRAENRAEKEEAKQTGHTHTAQHSAGNIGGGTAYTNVGTPGTYDSAPTGNTGRDYL